MSEMQIVDQSLDKSERKHKTPMSQLETNDKESDIGNEDVRALIEENLRLTKELRYMVGQLTRYVAWQRIFGVIKVLLILVPLIIGFIYLPPLLKEPFKQLLSILQSNVN